MIFSEDFERIARPKNYSPLLEEMENSTSAMTILLASNYPRKHRKGSGQHLPWLSSDNKQSHFDWLLLCGIFFQLLFHTILTGDATAQESLNAAVKDITFGYSFHICELCCAIPIAHSCLISELWIVMNCNYQLTHVNTTLHFMVYNMHVKMTFSLECMHKLHDLLGTWQHFLVLERSVMAVWLYASKRLVFRVRYTPLHSLLSYMISDISGRGLLLWGVKVLE